MAFKLCRSKLFLLPSISFITQHLRRYHIPYTYTVRMSYWTTHLKKSTHTHTRTHQFFVIRFYQYYSFYSSLIRLLSNFNELNLVLWKKQKNHLPTETWKKAKPPLNHPFICFFFFLSLSFIFIWISFLTPVKVIGGELQERLIPVPYSKNTTDQAVSSFSFISHFFRFPKRKNEKVAVDW